jgi:hypothetical protein
VSIVLAALSAAGSRTLLSLLGRVCAPVVCSRRNGQLLLLLMLLMLLLLRVR